MSCSRYFFHIGFSGINYRGWQIQASTLNVQGVLENALTQILKEPVSIMGCGRTDAMVHASQFFFHTDISREWDFDILFRLNKILPSDIAIYEIIKMPPNAHARFDATQRTYDYFVHTYKDPFLSNVSSLYLLKDPDIARMKKAVEMLPGYDNYRSFCTTPSRHRTTIVNVHSAMLWSDVSGDRLRFQITANRFLSSMIRILVGKLIDIGTGLLALDEFEEALAVQTAQSTIVPAYPQGLFLSSVKYPYLDIPPRAEFSTILQNTKSEWIKI